MKLLPSVLLYLLFVIILAVPPLVVNPNLLTPHFWLIFFFISALTFLVVIMVSVSQRINPELGTQMFLGATVFKILSCLAFTVVFLLKNKVNRYVFVADFFYVYFLNTAFEIYTLLRNLRNQNLK